MGGYNVFGVLNPSKHQCPVNITIDKQNKFEANALTIKLCYLFSFGTFMSLLPVMLY